MLGQSRFLGAAGGCGVLRCNKLVESIASADVESCKTSLAQDPRRQIAPLPDLAISGDLSIVG